jgi:immune inhibitor A
MTADSDQTNSKRVIWLVMGCVVAAACTVCASIMVVFIAVLLLLPFDRSERRVDQGSTVEPGVETPALAEAPTEAQSESPTEFPPADNQAASDNPTETQPPSVETAAEQTAIPQSTIPSASDIEQTPLTERHWLDLQALMDEESPPRDYYDTAARLGSSNIGERTVRRTPYEIGDRQVFRTEEGRVQAELLAITDHAYFWVETALAFDPESVAAAAGRFEQEFYPVVTRLFGEEWRPGVDNDTHFSVLHLDGYIGDGELGFFNSGDEYPWAVVIDSNQQEIVYLNMANLRLGDSLYHGTLIHEVQHLIQWHNDPNESVWLNEGLAQLTELYAGLDTVDTATDYLHNTDIRLNSWNFDDEELLYAHYGASYLFSVYLWEQLGISAISALSSHADDGLAGVQTILKSYRPEQSLEDFLGDWIVANYVDDLTVGPNYGYANLRLHRPEFEAEISSSDFGAIKNLNQYGVHYIKIDRTGPTTINFVGDTIAELMGDSSLATDRIWYAPTTDELDAQLTVDIDLQGLDEATLEFSVWYDLEELYDFAYVTISTDEGISWDILEPRHASLGEFGPAFGGRSRAELNDDDGWLRESIDLTPFTGKTAILRFEVLTDLAINSGGFAIDRISIPELDFVMDPDTHSDMWSADGFVETGRLLPQSWKVILIQEGDNFEVTPLALNELNRGQWTVDLDEDGGVLVIAALNPIVDSPVGYWLAVE